MNNYYFSYSFLILSSHPFADAFVLPHAIQKTTLTNVCTTRGNRLNSDRKGKDEEEEIYYVDSNVNADSRYTAQVNVDNNENMKNEASFREKINNMDDLTPPTINLSRDSILFSKNPSTKRKNPLVHFWKLCKTNLPPIVTGAWPWKEKQQQQRSTTQDNVIVYADDNPIGAIYNMAFVRMPVIGILIAYAFNLLHGHPLIMDIGQGPFEVSPFIVFSVLAFILA